MSALTWFIFIRKLEVCVYLIDAFDIWEERTEGLDIVAGR